MDLLQVPKEERWAKVSFHKTLAAGRPGGPIRQMPSVCRGSHLRAAGANLAFYSETVGTTGLQEEPGKGWEEYVTCVRLHALLGEAGGTMILLAGKALH